MNIIYGACKISSVEWASNLKGFAVALSSGFILLYQEKRKVKQPFLKLAAFDMGIERFFWIENSGKQLIIALSENESEQDPPSKRIFTN